MAGAMERSARSSSISPPCASAPTALHCHPTHAVMGVLCVCVKSDEPSQEVCGLPIHYLKAMQMPGGHHNAPTLASEAGKATL